MGLDRSERGKGGVGWEIRLAKWERSLTIEKLQILGIAHTNLTLKTTFLMSPNVFLRIL